jgi:hypothetical protein
MYRDGVYDLADQIKENVVGGTRGRGEENVRVLVGKPEGKRPLVRPRRRWEDRVRMDHRDIGLGVWIGFDWLRAGTGGGLW